MAYRPIDAHGLIGNMRTAALVSDDGSIDWLCLPHFDSPSVFAALLDDRKGGRFKVTAEVPDLDVRQFYVPDTNVLVTRFVSPTCLAEVIDFMPLSQARHGKLSRPDLLRVVRVEFGQGAFTIECRPRFDYARAPHRVQRRDGAIAFDAGPAGQLHLSSTAPMDPDEDGGAVARVSLSAGDVVVLSLNWGDELEEPWRRVSVEEADDLLVDTTEYWRGWIAHCTYHGQWSDRVRRSALALKLLTFAPTGAIVAAPTCGLPEHIGGQRNWDYRYVWLRDAAFTVFALIRIGFTEEAARFMDWLEQRCHELEHDRMLRPLYGIDGRHELIERELDHLEGYKGSRPVRVGNAAHTQCQLDIYGTVMDAAYLHDKHASPLSFELWTQLRRLLDWVASNWRDHDNGPWEMRGPRRDFTYSKVMCWVALDRGLRLASSRGFPGDVDRWRRTRDHVYEAVMRRGWSATQRAFVQDFDGHALDASCLMFPIATFLAPNDPRMLSTFRALDRPLGAGGLVSDFTMHRYDPASVDDGVREPEGSFNVCSFWFVEALTQAGRTNRALLERARLVFHRLLRQSNHLGLWAEQTGRRGEALGNFPQGLTHLSFITAAVGLDAALRSSRPGHTRRERLP